MKSTKNIEVRDWNIRFLRLLWFITALAFFVAFILYLRFDDVEHCSKQLYFMNFVAVPTSMQILICLFMELFVRVLSGHLPNHVTAIMLAVGLEIQCGLMVMVHTSVGEMAVALIVPLFLSMVYNSKVILVIQSILAAVIYVITQVYIVPEAIYVPKNDVTVHIIVFVGLLLAAFVWLHMLLGWQIEMHDEMEEYRNRSRRQEEQLRVDSLTGIWNYKSFIEVLAKKIEQLHNFPGQCVLVLFDIDGLYRINEQYGYTCGDEVIMKLTEIIKRNVRHKDYLARYNGEEFMLILNEVNLDIAQQIATRIQDEFAAYKFEQCNQESNTISVGIAQWCDHYINNLDFVSKAEHALRLAKMQGYGNLNIYTETEKS